MPISGFDLKIKIRTIENNFPFHFFQTITYILYQNFLFRITHIPIAHSVHANYYRHISILVIQYTHTHTRIHRNTYLFYTPRYIACTRETARTSIHERSNTVVCGSPFKTRIVHDPEKNVAGFSTSLGASAGSSASGNLPIRSRNHRLPGSPRNVEKSFPRSESRLGTPPTRRHSTFAKRLNVWNVIYRFRPRIDNNFLFRCYFSPLFFSFSFSLWK